MAGRDFAYEPVPSDTFVKLRLDLLSACRLGLCYLGTFALILTCIIIASFAPAMFRTHQGDIYQCSHLPPYKHEDCFGETAGLALTPTWIGTLRGVGPMSQFFVISADIYGGPELNSSSVDFDLSLTVSLQAQISAAESKEILAAKPLSFPVTCSADKRLCSSVFLGYEPYVEYRTYDVMISLTNWGRIERWVEEIEIKVRSVAPNFSLYQLRVKSVFLLAAVVSAVVYLCQLCKAKVQRWSSETRCLFLLSLSLIVFNDPFYFYSLYHPHYLITAASVLCVVQFLCVLAYFWALVLMEVNTQAWHSKCKGVLGLGLAVMGGSLAAVYVYSAVLMRNDPSYRLADFPTAIWVLSLVSVAMMGTYLIFLAVLTVTALPVLGQRTVRQRFLCVINFIMAVFAGVCVATGLFQRLPSLGSFVLIVISTFNLYVFLLQALLVPTSIRLTSQSDIELSESK